MRIETCSVSGEPIYPGHGMTYVRNDGKVFHFATKKARKMFERRVTPKHLKWTKAYRRSKGKELSVDPTFELEKKNNAPQKYDREIYAKTIKAMKRISEMRENRQRSYYLKRMAPSLKQRKMRMLSEVSRNIDLAYAPVSAKRQAMIQKEKEEQKRLESETKLQNALSEMNSVSNQQNTSNNNTNQNNDEESDEQIEE